MASRWLAVAAPLLALWLYYTSLFERPASVSSRRYTHELIATVQKLLREESWEEVLAPLQRLQKAYPKNHVYLAQLAGVYEHLRRPADEAAALEQFVLISPSPYEACPRLGFAYREQGMAAESLKAFERCLGFAPTDSDNLLFLGLAYERSHDDDKADELYARAAAVAPNYPDVAIGRGRIALHRGEPARALALVKNVLARGPDNADALLVAGLATLRLGDRTAARDYLEHGLRERNDSDLRLALGMLEEKEHRRDQAIANYAEALRLRPSNRDAEVRLADLQGRAP